MIHEFRSIILSADELIGAFEGYCRLSPDFLPKGQMVNCVIAGEDVVLTMEIVYGNSPPQKLQFNFNSVDLLKPLIRFCIENNIMLPRDGKKTIEIKNDRVVLHIEMDLSVDMPATLNPLQLSHLKSLPMGPHEKFVVHNGGKI